MRIVADANIPFVRECFSSVGDVQVLSGRDITPGAVAKVDALLVRSITPVNEALLADAAVRFVGTATIGFDHVDVPYLDERKIGFASAPGSNANSAAEYVIAALLEVSQKRRITLEGKSIGVIGVGNVGRRVARKCEALGMRVLRNDPPLQRQTGDPVYVPIQALYDCDFIAIHTPLTRDGIDKTFHLADARFLSSLRAGAVFVNASRGAVAETEALEAAIQSHRLRAAVLDVWEGEPCVDITLLEKVDLGTPHIAGYSYDGKIAGMIMIYKAFCDYFGVTPKFDAKDFLPEPEVPRLTMTTSEPQTCRAAEARGSRPLLRCLAQELPDPPRVPEHDRRARQASPLAGGQAGGHRLPRGRGAVGWTRSNHPFSTGPRAAWISRRVA
jgi:erythronate-4-phosphate dehydrogenase